MAGGFFPRRRQIFKAVLAVQANPYSTVTATGPDTYEAEAGETGYVVLTVKKKGTYTVTSSAGGSATVAAVRSNQIYAADIVYVAPLPAFAVATWATGAACCYWTAPLQHSDGVLVRRAPDGYPSATSGTRVYTGWGTSLALSYTQTVTGVVDAGLTPGQAFYYAAFSVLTVNGKTYYSAPSRSAYTAESCTAWAVLTYTGQSYTIPVGVRTISVCCVGAGGAGGAGGVVGTDESHAGAGGGAGGYMTVAAYAVLPGQPVSGIIGAGNTGAGGTTQFGLDASGAYAAAGGGAGLPSGPVGNTSVIAGGSGGSGGGAGGNWSAVSGAGGVNGSSGGSTAKPGGSGDGQTKTFAGTVYADGGSGGAGMRTDDHSQIGSVGAVGGHGGGLGGRAGAGAAGTAGTGSGGGGGGVTDRGAAAGGIGGSGVIIIKEAA